MNLKNTSILTAALALIAGILWITQTSKSRPIQSDLVGQGLLETDNLSRATHIQIFENQSDTPSVEINQSGEEWIVPNRYGLPADFSKVTDLVNGLSESKIIRAVTENPDRIKTLDIGQSRIVMKDSEGNTLSDISFGKEGNTQGYFALLERSEKAILASDKPFFQTTPDRWTVTSAWDFSWDAVRAVSDESISLEKSDADADFSASDDADQMVDQDELQNGLSRLTNLRFQDLAPIDSQDVTEAMEYAYTFSITLDSGDRFDFKIGRRPEITAPESTDDKIADASETSEEETESIPAGTPYLIVQQSKASDLWKGIFAKYALEITSFSFEQLPQSLKDFITEDEPSEPTQPSEL